MQEFLIPYIKKAGIESGPIFLSKNGNPRVYRQKSPLNMRANKKYACYPSVFVRQRE